MVHHHNRRLLLLLRPALALHRAALGERALGLGDALQPTQCNYDDHDPHYHY
jgi:hypothetical protein